MTALYFIFGVFTFIWVYFFLRLSISTKLLVPIAGFLFFIFLSALGSHSFTAILAQLSRVFSLSFIIAELLRTPHSRSFDLFSFVPLRIATLTILLLALILLVHNLWNLDFLFDNEKLLVRTVNPWGLFFNCLISLYLLRAVPSAGDLDSFHSKFAIIALSATVILFLMMIMVLLGFIEGNSQKVAFGIGGIGLANHSTNETGLLATILLLWNIRYISFRKANRICLFVAIILCVIIILLTRSRLALGLSMFIIFVAIMAANCKLLRKLAIAIPLLIALLPISLKAISERNAADQSGNIKSQVPIQRLPGSGRLLIWLFYTDAFFYTAQSNPTTYLFGVGMSGLPNLYKLTPLSEPLFNISLDKIDYYPLHSDFVLIFLVAGAIGGLIWISHFVMLTLSLKRPSFLFQFSGAMAILFFYSLFDMLIYSPLAIYLTYLAIAEGSLNKASMGILKRLFLMTSAQEGRAIEQHS